MSRYLVNTAPTLAGVDSPDADLVRMYPVLGRGFSARRTGRYREAEGGKVQHWCEIGPHGNGGNAKPALLYAPAPVEEPRGKRVQGTGTVRFRRKGQKWQVYSPASNGKSGKYLGAHETRQEAEAVLDEYLGETEVS